MSSRTDRRTEPMWLRVTLTGMALTFFVVLLAAPLLFVVWSGLAKGVAAWAAAISRPDTVAAFRQTLTVVAWVISLNTLFGLMAAYAVSKFRAREATRARPTVSFGLTTFGSRRSARAPRTCGRRSWQAA